MVTKTKLLHKTEDVIILQEVDDAHQDSVLHVQDARATHTEPIQHSADLFVSLELHNQL